MKLLFVCSRNKWRSPTAEKIFSNRATLEVRARGLSSSANRRLVADDVSWADTIIRQNADRFGQGPYPRFVTDNPAFIELTKQRVASYWNCYFKGRGQKGTRQP
jgi:hypothetical protein